MTMREAAIPKSLSGLELQELIRQDFEKLLRNEGSLSHHIAYGRIAYEIRLRLFVDNPMMPRSEIEIKSSPIAPNLIAAHPDPDEPKKTIAERPGLHAVERPPLVATSADATRVGVKLKRNVTKPNAERVRAGLPVPVEVRQQDGTKTIEKVVYPALETDDKIGDMTVAEETHEEMKTP